MAGVIQAGSFRMVDAVGRLESLKKRLITLIDTAVSSNPYFCHTTGEWSDIPRQMTHLPLVTVRLGTSIPADEHYGLLLSSDNQETIKGRFEYVPFTAHVFASACKESGEEEIRYAHQVSDAIIDYLEQRRFAQTAYEIHDIDDMTQRESIPEGLPRNVKRMIVEGRLFVRKTQDTYNETGATLPFRLA